MERLRRCKGGSWDVLGIWKRWGCELDFVERYVFEAGGVLMQCLCLWLPKSMINNSSTTKWDAQPESSEMNFVLTLYEQTSNKNCLALIFPVWVVCLYLIEGCTCFTPIASKPWSVRMKSLESTPGKRRVASTREFCRHFWGLSFLKAKIIPNGHFYGRCLTRMTVQTVHEYKLCALQNQTPEEHDLCGLCHLFALVLYKIKHFVRLLAVWIL